MRSGLLREKEKRMATFVLVPGAWHGSWAFEAVELVKSFV
jgi:hypothetical protein